MKQNLHEAFRVRCKICTNRGADNISAPPSDTRRLPRGVPRFDSPRLRVARPDFLELCKFFMKRKYVFYFVTTHAVLMWCNMRMLLCRYFLLQKESLGFPKRSSGSHEVQRQRACYAFHLLMFVVFV